jgi:hypothetical protein
LLLALSVVAPLSAPLSAYAQTSVSETAKVTQLFKSGKAAFGRGDMPEAERLFAEAFALRKSSDIAANLAQSELEQQKYRAAAEHFQWALTNLLPSASDAQRKAVETGLTRSRAEVASLRLEIEPAGADVLVGEMNLGKSPISSGVYVDPGEVIVSVKREGFVAIDKRVLAAKGTEQAVEIRLLPKEASSEPAPAPTPVDSGLKSEVSSGAVSGDALPAEHKSLVPAYIATGVAVAGGVTGLVLLLRANSKADEADSIRDELQSEGGCGDDGTAPAASCADLVDRRKSIDSTRNLEIGAFVVGGVAALVAGYFYWDALSHRQSGSDQATRRSSPAPRLAVTPRVELSRAAGAEGGALPSFKLGLSGTF